jgi:NAD(P)-dependent dehydrogenase (short-subunit alcohol dehydrogenase family)
MRSVLITGASTGIGRATALRMDSIGWQVFAGVRRDEDAEALRQAGSERLVPLRLEITDRRQIAEARQRIADLVGDAGLDGLVNNAGIIVVGPVETLPLSDFRHQIEVNLIGHIAVAQELLPLLRQASGRVVFVGSIGGRMSYPFGAAYHASKYGLEAVASCLRQELRPWKINVAIIEPGAIDTQIFERGERVAGEVATQTPVAQALLYEKTIDRMLEMGKKLQTHANPPESVAKAIAHALGSPRPRRRYRVGLDAHAQVLAHRLLPGTIFDWVIAKALGV